ncbi:MAG: YkgJ family cysteine cluster protein [Methanosarcinales archaeon]
MVDSDAAAWWRRRWIGISLFARLLNRSNQVFECRRCAACCRSLVINVGQYQFGLSLLPEECAYFPSDVVAPFIGVSSKDSSDIEVIMFQLTESVCPNLDENSLCKIYDNRPLACRIFPFWNVNALKICPAFRAAPDAPIPIVSSAAHTKLSEYLRKKAEGTIWQYPLNLRRWIRSSEL